METRSGTENLEWLDEMHGERALAWAHRRAAATDAALDSPEHRRIVGQIAEALDAPDRLVLVTKHGSRHTNFWQDQEHPRGLWRSTDWESYAAGAPAWETLLDLDALSAEEGTDWVWAGSTWRPEPQGAEPTRVLVSLSPDGGDATRIREFDVASKAWVPGGFDLPLGKTNASWSGPDELLVGAITGEDDVTRSSYARCVRCLARGASLADAPVVFEVDASHVAAGAGREHTRGFEREVAWDSVDFYDSIMYLRTDALGSGGDPEWTKIDVPLDARVSLFREWLVIRPMSEWEVGGAVYAPGTLLTAPLSEWLAGERAPRPVFVPGPGEAISSLTFTASKGLLTVLRDVASRVLILDPADGWSVSELPGVPELSSVSVWPVDDEDPTCGEDYWMLSSGFLEPSTLRRGTLAASAGASVPAALIAAAPERFDASGFEVSQRFAVSADGTRVPYFLVVPRDAPLDGRTPVLISAYGGFRASLTPGYSPAVGLGWLQRTTADGRHPAYVLANLRGGGEYGPAWHAAALREKRPRAFEDLAAVAADLQAYGLSSPSTTTMMGRSNGGLLAGNAYTRYPELFGGISCGVPLLDMLRYTTLSAGHSWIAEYGDPEVPEDAAFLREMSPVHRLHDHPQTVFPPLLVWTTTSDDRVGPVQARHMAAALDGLGVDTAWYHEEEGGGHAGSVDHADTARMLARSYSFLWLAATAPERLRRA
ncbi:MAG: prolyl oligopeptidase family serine peptidase [Arthrobacter sp.]|jgi:prolyl oligopeptidase|nr:prolyl oligopeptidase family serine peptidase [Arthrobacter sp.]